MFGLNKPKEEKQEQKRPDDWVSLGRTITQAEDWEEKRQMMAQVNYYRETNGWSGTQPVRK